MRLVSALAGGCAGLALLVPATITAAITPTASAATWTHRDARGDVRALTADGPPEGRPTPTRETSDLTTVKVRHGGSQVVVTLRVRDLRSGPQGVFVEMRTPAPGRYVVELVRLPDYRTLRLTHDGEVVACPELRQRMDVDEDTVRIRVPRACLGTPATVRAGAGMFVQTDDGTRADDGLLDDALRKRLKLGPPVASG